MKKFWITILSLAVAVCAVILIYSLTKNDKMPPSLESNLPALSVEDTEFDANEQKDMLDFILDKTSDIEILDSVFGDKNTTVSAAAICKDLSTGAETIVSIVTGRKKGFIDVASGIYDYEYYSEDGITVDNSDTVLFSLLDRSTSQIHECSIVVTITDEHTHYELSSNIRPSDD